MLQGIAFLFLLFTQTTCYDYTAVRMLNADFFSYVTNWNDSSNNNDTSKIRKMSGNVAVITLNRESQKERDR
jgi:hypothetical protein